MWGLQVTIAVRRRNLCSDMTQCERVCLTGRYDGEIVATFASLKAGVVHRRHDLPFG
jgi:hypothetical protein